MKAATILVGAVSLLVGGAAGWVCHLPSAVHAADYGPVEFQLQGTGPSSELGLYYPNDRDLYVYPGVAAGNSTVNCAFKVHIARAGGPLERSNCGVGKLN